MNLNLSGKNVFIAGSTRGIGLEIAKHFISEGANVVISGTNDELVKARVLELENQTSKVFGFAGDFRKPQVAVDAINYCCDVFGDIDIVVCNVGSGASVPPGSETFEEWQKVFSLNLWATTNIVEAAKSTLKESSGNIVCVSSICGSEIISGAPITYAVAKSALNTYVTGISRPLARDGIRINAVSPGNILFPGSVWERKIAQDLPATMRMLDSDVPLNRFGTTEEIASAVLFLSSEVSSFTTGTIFIVDGGQHKV
jgi:3-oxoacyl-[acyl-carrier protein] reductase